MNKISELLKEVCPNGVKKYPLSELGSFYGGLTGKSKEDFKDGNAKFISYMNVFTNPALRIDVSDKVRILEGEKQNTIQYGDVLFTGSSETPNECGMSSVLTIKTDEKLYLNSFSFGFRFNDLTDICPDYLKHLFRSQEIRDAIAKTANGVTRFNVSKKLFAKIQIPLPPLPVQQEIVKILDSMTELQQNLQDELEARKKQYETYREKLLTFNEIGGGIKRIKLLDMLCQPISDGPHESPIFVDFGIPFISVDAIENNRINFNRMRGYISEEYDNYCRQKYSPQKNDVFLVKSGSTVGKVAIADTDIRFNIWSPLAAMRTNANNSPKFLYYLLQTDCVQQQVKDKCSKGSQPNLSMRVLEKFDVTIPSLDVQEKIVLVLDSLVQVIDTISEELSLRTTQYEYYREQLLAF